MDKTQIIEALKSMTILEINELVKALEEEFGVSAVAVAAPAAGAAAAEEEEKSEFNVVLKEIGQEKIKVIKAVREAVGTPAVLRQLAAPHAANCPHGAFQRRKGICDEMRRPHKLGYAILARPTQ